jgi:hypothetical protein
MNAPRSTPDGVVVADEAAGAKPSATEGKVTGGGVTDTGIVLTTLASRGIEVD